MHRRIARVRPHISHSRLGKVEHVIGHPMRVNERIHKAHEARLEREIKALEKQRAR